jgi:hypothetical protein
MAKSKPVLVNGETILRKLRDYIRTAEKPTSWSPDFPIKHRQRYVHGLIDAKQIVTGVVERARGRAAKARR